MYDTQVTLVKETSTGVSAIGRDIITRTEREVFAELRSVTQSEWFSATAAGLKPSHVLAMSALDYGGEAICELHGELYSIYRTYQKGLTIELYLQRELGV